MYANVFYRYTAFSLFLVLSILSKCCFLIKWQLELQPVDVDRGDYDALRPDDGHLCYRTCERGEIPRICYYKFHLEEYTVLSSVCGDCPNNITDCLKPGCVTADAYKQKILTVNRRLPGPSIQVCKGDTVLVEVINNIPDSNVTIHWHGVKHLGAPGTPWMDGVPYITQCPILYNQTFQYHFVPGESGTFLWHSYDGEKQLQGLVGSLIVREPYPSDSLRRYYDHDLPSHTILVQDWIHQVVESNSIETMLRFLVVQPKHSEIRVPVTYLVNGRGLEPTSNSRRPFPLAEFYVSHGFRYRFRLIGATSLTCPFRITIQGHRLLVISADINPIQPVMVDSLIISSGERYDVVLNATQPVCSYWILVEGVGECSSAQQAALLRYHGCTLDTISVPSAQAASIPSAANRYTLNPPSGECCKSSLPRGVCASQLKSPSPNHLRLSRQPDFRFMVNLDPRVTAYDDPPFSPYSSLALTTEMPNSTTVVLVPLNAVFEILTVNTRNLNMSLSCHIHGHDFYILEQGRLPEASLSQGLHELQHRLADKGFVSRIMPSKDTVAVPDYGYTVVRVLADNPGFWLLRCNTDPAISAIIQVGHLFDMPPLPSEFPTCQGFNPNSKDFLTM